MLAALHRGQSRKGWLDLLATLHEGNILISALRLSINEFRMYTVRGALWDIAEIYAHTILTL